MENANEVGIEYWESRLIGKTFVKEEESCSGDQYVKRSQLPAKNRVIGPGQFVTCDYISNRLNVRIDANNIIHSVKFG